jgi:hypothetical protein
MMRDVQNAKQNGIDPHLWAMVAQIGAQIENAEPIAWSSEGMVQFLFTYPDGTNALVEWAFDKRELITYAERWTDEQRAQYVSNAVQVLTVATDTREKLKTLPEGIKHVGFIPRLISKEDSKG